MLNFSPTQNTKSNINNIENSHQSQNSSSDNFLNTLLKNLKNENNTKNDENLQNKTTNNQNITQENNANLSPQSIEQEQMQNQNIVLEGVVIAKESSNIKDVDLENSSLDNDSFMQILQILEAINGGEISKFPSMSNTLEKFISIEENLLELKNINNMQDLLKIAQKLELNLSKISISSNDLVNLKNKFPTLNELDFFKNTQSKLNNILATNNIQNTSNAKVSLADLLKTTQTNVNLANLLQNEKKLVVKENNINQNLKNINKISSQQTFTNIISPKQNDEFNVQTYLDAISKKAANALEDTLTQTKEQNFIFEDKNKISIKDAINFAKIENKNITKEVATQGLRNFSNELTRHINDFKPPVTRINMQLNPAQLGEVNVTMIVRANNLQINITSTNNTMALFLQNQAEFKANLVNMGFSEIQMNFSDNKQNGEHFEYKKMAKKAYKNDDMIINEIEENSNTTLEIILPRYI